MERWRDGEFSSWNTPFESLMELLRCTIHTGELRNTTGKARYEDTFACIKIPTGWSSSTPIRSFLSLWCGPTKRTRPAVSIVRASGTESGRACLECLGGGIGDQLETSCEDD